MELRQRAPSERLDHDEPFSERLLARVEGGCGERGGVSGTGAGSSVTTGQRWCYGRKEEGITPG